MAGSHRQGRLWTGIAAHDRALRRRHAEIYDGRSRHSMVGACNLLGVARETTSSRRGRLWNYPRGETRRSGSVEPMQRFQSMAV